MAQHGQLRRPSTVMFAESNAPLSRTGGYHTTHSDPNISSSSAASSDADDFAPPRNSSFSAFDSGVDPNNRLSGECSPIMMSPWNQTSPFAISAWSNSAVNDHHQPENNLPQSSLICSLVREEGHIYSLAARNNVLYTGSDSKNIRVWKNMQEFSAFKSNSGLVKAIIISGDKIFTGHQDGKIRVWKIHSKNPSTHKRVGTMPTFFDIFKASIRPKNYIEVKRNRTALWIKHTDAISCLSMNVVNGFLYSASWDRTFKVWSVDSSKCVESVKAHDDAVNSVVSSVDGIVYTGSADGTVKVWRREQTGKAVRHVADQTLLSQDCAVTALAVNESGTVVYCGSSDGLVNFWEMSEKQRELSHGGVLKGHKLAVLCLETAGNQLVLSGSADKTICVWRREGAAHTCLSVLSGHTGPVKCLAVEEDSGGGERKWVVYSGSLDKSVKVWSVSETAPDLQQKGLVQRRDGDDFNWESIPSAKY